VKAKNKFLSKLSGRKKDKAPAGGKSMNLLQKVISTGTKKLPKIAPKVQKATPNGKQDSKNSSQNSQPNEIK